MLVSKIDFDWDPRKEAANRSKHGVGFVDAMTVFHDPLSATIFDGESNPQEDRWVTLGLSRGGGLLVVVHTWVERDDGTVYARLISARRATKREARDYREGHHEA